MRSAAPASRRRAPRSGSSRSSHSFTNVTSVVRSSAISAVGIGRCYDVFHECWRADRHLVRDQAGVARYPGGFLAHTDAGAADVNRLASLTSCWSALVAVSSQVVRLVDNQGVKRRHHRGFGKPERLVDQDDIGLFRLLIGMKSKMARSKKATPPLGAARAIHGHLARELACGGQGRREPVGQFVERDDLFRAG